ncbi:MAG: hypothetical protein AAF532_14160 [Planctomycetota bacterium]
MVPPAHEDLRLYLKQPDVWRLKVKPDFVRQYCHGKNPGEEHYHLIVGGELYVDNGERKLCLNCALRAGVVTADREHWRRGRDD